ncbi:predicted protein [Naegleria gruberi]|uniref:Predicted protein n=1 Tax=Naegleria gruberi TaxID=5762 RepID=D2VHV4_NAEGR|nr:uncharacterized protein NAEGRDRAFT_68458 [Naegleria gruberi]EFC43657.1 predicted protein [Naegleria gruberi]|eukprot:XP_002676401.1 predicted protein [Naegleria gruberi strain NEG-M]
MKLYIHDEISEDTRVIIYDSAASDFNALINLIQEEFGLKNKGKKVEQIRDERNKTITKKEQLKEKMDLYIQISEQQKQQPQTEKAIEKPNTIATSSSINANSNNSTKPSEVPSATMQKELNALADSAVKHFQAREYRKAVKAYKLLQASNVDSMGCMSNIATVYIAASKFDRALKYLLKCLEMDKYNQNIYKLLGKCYFGLKNYKESLQNFYHQVTILEKYQKEIKDESKLKDITELIQDGYVDMAKCLTLIGEKQQGFSFIASVLKKNDAHKVALLEYAKYVLYETKDASDSITATLRILVADQNNVDAKDILSEIVETFGVEPLLNHISQGSEKLDTSAAPGLAWMALILKEHSCINEAVVLYKTALKLAPSNFAYLLNLVHTLEIDVRFKDALCEIKEFCKNNPTVASGTFTTKVLLEVSNFAFSFLT